ncbi:MAG: YifB family Mg chelatase-like AAA ATPase [Bacteroidetes bacterium]|nr:YifB family Mg chelatase-like AAA ATPase [Bacteroidota bacterium]
MLIKTFASAVQGVDAQTIAVEVNAGGLVAPNKKMYHLVGLPDNAVREGFERIEAALKNNRFKIPRIKIVVNLAPADIRKAGSSYDLPIALGILGATRQLDLPDIEEFMIMGELSLDGSLRPITGALPMAIQARKERFKGLILPIQNAREAAIVNDLDVYGVENMQQAIDVLTGEGDQKPVDLNTRDEFARAREKFPQDFADVKGQEKIKRALEMAAAGGHNVILIGPPGAGKTMLARRMPTILPPLSLHEALETTKIHSVAGKLPSNASLIAVRPFRSPHHTISDVALVGGGSQPSPGEISLAHHGVLFLDELPEFKRTVLEVLRQPMEERKVTISRARLSVDYPASFMLVASMNPCPCGFYNHPDKECVCSPGVVQRYLNKISGPLLDRIDLHVEVTPVSYEMLSSRERPAESSIDIAERVVQARQIQQKRFEGSESLFCNAQMTGRMVREVCALDADGAALLKKAMERLQLSARAYDRILKVARTAADLGGSDRIKIEHLAEAIQYRSLDREDWV